MTNPIEECVRINARFPALGRGPNAASVEQVYHLTKSQIENLYAEMAVGLTPVVETLTNQETPERAALRVKLDALRYIHGIKVAEAQAAETALAKAQEKRRLEKALLRKKEDKIKAMPEEEIEQLISSL